MVEIVNTGSGLCGKRKKKKFKGKLRINEKKIWGFNKC